MNRNQSGFTLIEIAIVLVIIGLLLGGVLKGQELINSAKVKNLATDFRNIPLFIYGYQDKFRAVPGDDSQATTHVGASAQNCGSVVANHCNPGNGLIDGDWDATSTADETQLFWQQVRLAGLAAGPTTGDMLPTNALGGIIGITSSANNPDPTAVPNKLSGTYIICSAGILGKFATQLDTQMDDSSPTTGSMKAFNTNAARPSTLSAPTLVNGQLDPNLTYTVCLGV